MVDRRRTPRLAAALAAGLVILGGCGSGSTAPPASGVVSPSTIASPAGASAAGASAAAASPAAGGGGVGGPVAAGGDLCGLLGPGDFAAAGVAGTATPKENNPDANNAYCVYAGQSAGTGGVEFDAFLAGSTADSKASYDAASAPMLDLAGDGKAAFPDADGAAIRTDVPGGYAGITIWKGRLVFDIGYPTTSAAKDQLIALARLVLQRAAALE